MRFLCVLSYFRLAVQDVSVYRHFKILDMFLYIIIRIVAEGIVRKCLRWVENRVIQSSW